jgi:hypothetical protein
MKQEIQFGDWTVIDPTGLKWLCRCKCGVERPVLSRDLKSGKSTGCGCERMRKFRAAALKAVTKHGMTNTPEFWLWQEMIRRCQKDHRPDYPRHGGRGIEVCERWAESFEAFISDMGRRPFAEAIIHRIDKNGPFSPENCEWSTRQTQGRNNRTNRLVFFKGEHMPLARAAELAGINYSTVCNRVNTLGWSVEDALTRPVAHQHAGRWD